MPEHTDPRDPRTDGREVPDRGQSRDGRRPERDRPRERRSLSFRERSERALADVGIYGTVSFRDLARVHFGDRPHSTRRAVDAWIREGLARESMATGPGRETFNFLTLTRAGEAIVRELATEQGMAPGQRIRASRPARSRVAHEAAIYRACALERRRLLEQGASVGRVRLDAELKATVLRRRDTARARGGQPAADAERHRAAADLGLPVDEQGRVLYPDAQIEYTGADGRPGRLHVEVASRYYSQLHIRAKARAGFRLHADGPAAARLLRSLGTD